MIEFFSELGIHTSLIVMLLVILFVYFGHKGLGLTVTWRCGMCGKTNETNLFVFFLRICDHTGDTL